MSVCVKCGNRLDRIKRGVITVTENGTVRRADITGCPECGYQIISGFGAEPREELAEAWLEHADPANIYHIK